MKKFIVSALLVTGALLAQTSTPAPAGQTDTTKKTAKKHKKHAAKTTATPAPAATDTKTPPKK